MRLSANRTNLLSAMVACALLGIGQASLADPAQTGDPDIDGIMQNMSKLNSIMSQLNGMLSGSGGSSGANAGQPAANGGANGGWPDSSGNMPGLTGGVPGSSGSVPGLNGLIPGFNGTTPGMDAGMPGSSGVFPGLSGGQGGMFGGMPMVPSMPPVPEAGSGPQTPAPTVGPMNPDNIFDGMPGPPVDLQASDSDDPSRAGTTPIPGSPFPRTGSSRAINVPSLSSTPHDQRNEKPAVHIDENSPEMIWDGSQRLK